MSLRKFHAPTSGFTGGVNTEASILNILPTELMRGTTNIVLAQNGSARRRRGVDFVGTDSNGFFLQNIRVFPQASEPSLDCPNAVFVRLSAPNGNLVERVVLDVSNEFLIYDATAAGLRAISSPRQTIQRLFTDDTQRYFYMSFAASGDKLFFAGEHTQPGYLKVADDNINLEIVYYDVIIRDPDNLSSTIKRYDATVTPTAADTYPKTVDHFAGRVWLSGDPRFPNQVLFSQVIVASDDVSKFHQEADPNDPDDPDLVDDDGGVINIQGAGLINQIISIKSSMFLGANNGIWQITGGSGIFKATDFGSHKVLGDGVDGSAGMVAIDEEIIVFGQNSIWVSKTESNTVSTKAGESSFRSLSKDKIETIYAEMPVKSKEAGRALYSRGERKAYFFCDADRTTFTKSFSTYDQPTYFRNAIIVDTNFQEDLIEQDQKEAQLNRKVKNAFTFWDFADTASDEYPYISTPFMCKSISINSEPVVVGTDQVTVGGDGVVTGAQEEAKQHILCLASQRVNADGVIGFNIAFGTFNTTVLRDWASSSDYTTAYDSIVMSGITSFGNLAIKKSPMYLLTIMERMESGILDANNMDITPGGCRMNTAWDYSSEGHPKYGEFHNIYFPYRYGYSLAGAGANAYSHVYWKERVRGRGRALQVTYKQADTTDDVVVNFEAVTVDGEQVVTHTEEKDFNLVGCSLEFVANETIQ